MGYSSNQSFGQSFGTGSYLIAFCLVLSALSIQQASAGRRYVKEVCHLENFNASCPHGHVIMMQQAHYGRMRVGRCLSTSYFVGCYADVLPFTDAKCSGKRSCKISVLDPDLVKFQPCRKDLMAYLEASYTCIPVPEWSSGECVTSGHMTVNGPSGDLSFKIGHSMPIGTMSCPWQVKVEQGQRIRFDLFSFLPWKQDGTAVHDHSGMPCKYTLVFVDGAHETEFSLCENRERFEHVFTAQNSMVQVYLKTDAMTAYHGVMNTVLLHYQAEGCADLNQIHGAKIEREENTAVVRCHASTETWHLVCKDNAWIGDIKNCSKTSKSEEPVSGTETATEMKYKLHYGIVIAVTIGLILGILIGSILLMGMMHQRRKRKCRGRKGSRDSDSTADSESNMSQSTFLYGFTGGLDKSGYSPGSIDKSSIYAPFIPKPADILEIKDCEKDNQTNEIYSTNNNNSNNNTNNNSSNSSSMMSSFHMPNDQTPDVVFSPRLQRNNSILYQSVTGLNAQNAVYQSTTELCTCPSSNTTTTAVVGLPSRTSLYSLYSTFGGTNRQPESVLICPGNLSIGQETQEKKIVPV